MPDLLGIQIPKPQNWQDFEVLICDLYKEIWRDPGAQRNGRGGQPQHGVDVFGRPESGSAWAGVQCKGLKNYSDQVVTEKSLREEVDKALKFTPLLNRYFLATTAPADQAIQKIARDLTSSHLKVGFFPVMVVDWGQIEQELGKHISVLRLHYPTFFTATSPRFQSLGSGSFRMVLSSSDLGFDLSYLLDSKTTGLQLATSVKADMFDLMIELALNAFSHNRSTWCNILLDSYGFTVVYDGNSFNPDQHLNEGKPIGTGLREFIRFKTKFGKFFSLTQSDTNNENRIDFRFSIPISDSSLDVCCEIKLPRPAFGRDEIEIRKEDLPAGCSTMYFNWHDGFAKISSPSAKISIINQITRLLPQDGWLVIRTGGRDLSHLALDPRIILK